MLNPNSRSLYTSALIPPPGLVFDTAIATTFSMDPVLLLEAPVYLAMLATDARTEPDPLAILEGIRRYSRRITVYVQRGRIQIPQVGKPNALYGLLEEMVTEVAAPRGGVFHPKVWAIRFVRPDQTEPLYRLVVLTRNMTTDRSWDLSLQLEGTVGKKRQKGNAPLAHFFRLLPGLATGSPQPERVEGARVFADEIYRVQWELPAGFDEVSFYLPGRKRFDWNPPDAQRAAIISPFCSNEALHALAGKSTGDAALVSRPESLAALSPDTLQLFARCLHLDEAAETEGDEEHDNRPNVTGLHAKVYLFETHYYTDYTHLVMGSANATNAALIAGKNVELLVELVGKRKTVGGIDDLLSPDGMGEYLVDFNVAITSETDTARSDAEALLEKARSRLSDAVLSVACRPGSTTDSWELLLGGEIPPLEGVTYAVAWPITVNPDTPATLRDRPLEAGIRLGEYAAASVTGLIAFALRTAHPDVSVRFVLNLPLEGVPEDRATAILQTVIRNRDGFIRYLLLLLGEAEATASDSGFGSGWARWLARLGAGEDVPLLEELTRAYSRNPDKLSEIASLMKDLSRRGRSDIVPEDFLQLWTVFESAMGGSNG